MKKFLSIVGVISASLILLAFCFIAYNYYKIKTGEWVKWDNKWYTREQLAEKFPPQVYDVEAKNTPEEVYTNFRQALLDNNLEKALSFIVEENREEYRQAFEDKVKLEAWVKRLPEEIVKENEYSNLASFDINYGTESKNSATFIKNREGYWEIDKI